MISARRPTRPAYLKNIATFEAELRVLLERQQAGSSRADMARGQLEGVFGSGRAPVTVGELPGSVGYRAGYLGSHLMASLIRSREALAERTWPAASLYARALVDSQGQAALARPAPGNLFSAHAYAWLRMTHAEGSPGLPIERIMFRWLADGLGVKLTSEQTAAVEKRWQERDGALAPASTPMLSAEKIEPVAAIRVVLRPAIGPVGPEASGVLSLGFGLPEKAWEAARVRRYDASADPANDPEMRGFFELMVGDKVILRKAPVSVFSTVCALARARADGFPDRQSVCVIDDSTGTWALHLVRDPQQPRIQITETYTGSMAYVPTRAVPGLIDAFLKRFVEEASGRIPELTSWGELGLLGGYLAE